jgi:hypothetical protein
MKHIEVSKKITTAQTVDASAVKYSLVQRMKNVFHVETIGEGVENFAVSATGKETSYIFDLNVVIKCDSTRARIIVDGKNRVSLATRAFYIFSLLAILALGLKPGLLGPAPYNYAIDAMFFLVVGAIITHDYNSKLEEPQKMLGQILDTLEVEFG